MPRTPFFFAFFTFPDWEAFRREKECEDEQQGLPGNRGFLWLFYNE